MLVGCRPWVETANVPNGVTSIGDNAFKGCTGLSSITIPNSVTSIGHHAFESCTGLSSITIPNGVTSIGNHAFYYCTGLSSITIPNSVTSIGYEAFRGCTGLSSITIPNGMTSIGDHAFYECTGLSSVIILNGVTSIGESAFFNCAGLSSITIPNSVTSIGNQAFYHCTGLSSITIPNSVTSIGNQAFYGCTGLSSIFIPNSVTSIGDLAFCGCVGLSSITIPNSVISIGNEVFCGCYVMRDNLNCSQELSGLTIVDEEKDGLLIKDSIVVRSRPWVESSNVPSYVIGIGDNAFSFCAGLSSITIPNSVTSIGNSAFFGCTGLSSITISNGVTSIGNMAFAYCTGLSSITIPNSVTSIGHHAFSECTSLSSITIPNSVTSIGDGAFYRCSLRPLVIYSSDYDDYSCLRDMSTSVIIAHESEISKMKKYFSGMIIPFTEPYGIQDVMPLGKEVSFRVYENPYFEGLVTNKCVKVGDEEVTPDEDGMFRVTGLRSETEYTIAVQYQIDDEDKELTYEFTTKELGVYMKMSEKYQTSIVIDSIFGSLGETSLSSCGVSYNGETYEYTKGKAIRIDGLKPNTRYLLTFYANYGEESVTRSLNFTTLGMSPHISIIQQGVTTLSLEGSYEERGAHVLETGFVGYGTGNRVSFTGLTPQSTTSITYYVKTIEGGYEEHTASFTTPALELSTLQPKCVSSTCAIVAATTNISDEETSVGFQWRKYDAPESLKSSEGYAAVYNGQLEGYIKNLQPAFYYNVRAFYKASDGTYYYGDWVTFDPSDFSFFEPTVHTYSAENVTENSARIKAYVLAGTDEILQQGFEYWSSGIVASDKKSAPTVLEPSAEDLVTTVVSTGQVMTADLTDLLPGTTYCCRAFVKTSAGTAYGEEQTFTTLGYPTGIDDVDVAVTGAPEVMGYYDMSGRLLSAPCRGVNIVRYSDGTSRKIFVK
ncbi:MAG: leucine-rich repeat domain-containing protein [Bacteroidaceae bacterium]